MPSTVLNERTATMTRESEESPSLFEKIMEGVVYARGSLLIAEGYPNQFVVVYDKTVIAHGTDPDAVARQAAGELDCSLDQLMLTWISAPSTWTLNANFIGD